MEPTVLNNFNLWSLNRCNCTSIRYSLNCLYCCQSVQRWSCEVLPLGNTVTWWGLFYLSFNGFDLWMVWVSKVELALLKSDYTQTWPEANKPDQDFLLYLKYAYRLYSLPVTSIFKILIFKYMLSSLLLTIHTFQSVVKSQLQQNVKNSITHSDWLLSVRAGTSSFIPQELKSVRIRVIQTSTGQRHSNMTKARVSMSNSIVRWSLKLRSRAQWSISWSQNMFSLND